jgi:hypothetical protein
MARRVLLGVLLACAAGCTSLQTGPDSKNELPFGWVDEPTDGLAVERNVTSHGWALDDNTVSKVHVYLDGHYLAQTTITEVRPDVSKTYPRYAHGNDTHGWRMAITLPRDVTLGPHKLVFQAVDNQGATRDIGTADVRLDR